ncbi:MAG TPA: protein kinase [Gemmataceae bacterium]|nr:protein kinase [Gemmataceae bacterium]
MDPDPDRTQTHVPIPPDDSALDAGLAVAFGPDDVRRGLLQRPPVQDGNATDPNPLVRSNSPDLPQADPGRYELLGEIASGGMGIVLKGRDPNLRRDLAVKVLKPELVGSESAEQRFLEEARLTGQLQHPGVVPIYDLGRSADGRPFFAMKLVNGRTLADLLHERQDPATDRGRFLKVFEQICHTIAYAHSMGVIHRDLKPANVMVGEFSEVQVMDWGLAKVLPQGRSAGEGRTASASPLRDEPAGSEQTVVHTSRVGSVGCETAAGSVLGTPAFMSPEQAGGEIDKVDKRADVFGLGAMLCVVLTGQPPYVADSTEAIRAMAIRGDLAGALFRLAGCGADSELVELCQRCLDPDREARPRDASAVAAAVTAYLAGVEERAHCAEVDRAAAVARETEGRKRQRAQRALAGAILLTFAVGATAGTCFVTDRSARSAELNRAWNETERLIPDTANGQPAQRLATTRAALTAARTAEAQFGLGVGGADRRDRVRATIAQLEDQERDLQLLIDLEAAWLRQAEVTAEKRTFDRALAAPVYADAFRNAGINVISEDRNEVAEAVRRRPGLRIELAAALDAWAEIDPDVESKKRIREVARLADPDSPRARLAVLMEKKDGRGIADFVRALEVRTLRPTAAVHLARQLWDHGTSYPNRAAALLRDVHNHHPNDFWVNFTLAEVYATTDPPRTEEVIRFLTAALAVRPDVPLAYTMLGNALMARGREAEAMAAFRRSVNLNGHCFQARMMLIQHAEPAERAQYAADLEQLARELPQDIGVQRDLGEMFLRQNQFDRAAEQFHKVTALAPRSWLAWAYLGDCLDKLDRPEEAAVAFREAFRLTPGHEVVRNRLLTLLHRTGAAGEELQVFKTWYDRLPGGDSQRTKWGPHLKYLERQADLEQRLADFRDGRAEPASAGEAIGLARLCQAKRLYPNAVQFFTRAFQQEPALADHPQGVDRYNAACAAARAAAEPAPADVRAKFRKQALDWLRADLAARASRAKSDAERAALRKFLRETVQPDPDLAGVRSPWSLLQLPSDERVEWMKYWAEVDATEKAMRAPAAAPRSQEVKRKPPW